MDERTANGLWTRSPSYTNETQMYRLNESDGGVNDGSWNGNEHCRCLRFEESENSVSGNNSSSDSNSLTGESPEQPITMIGPMYLIEDFPEFIHFNTITSGSYIQDIAVSWIDAKRFCSQLEYDGYNDFGHDYDVEDTLQNWKNSCEFSQKNGFKHMIIVQPLVVSGNRVLTIQEMNNGLDVINYIQKSQKYRK